MTDTKPAAMSNRAVLRLPEFRKLFVAQSISDLGDGFTFTALLLLVNALTHSPLALAVLSIAVALPSMIGGILAGAVADRRDRRRIMILSDSVRAVLVLGFVLVGTVERLPILYVIAFAQASIGTLFSPARGAVIPRVVPAEGLMAANGLAQMSRMIGYVIGTSLAGMIVATTGQFWPAFVLDAVTFAISVLIVTRVDPAVGRPDAAPSGAPARGLGGSVVDGLRTIGASPTLLATIGGLGIAMLGFGAVNLLFVPFIINDLQESAIWLGPLEAAQSISMILAAGFVGVIAARISPKAMVVGGLLGIGTMIAAMSLTPNIIVLLVVVFMAGWFITPAQAATQTIVMTATADHVRGRVIGAFQATMSTTTIVSTAAAGILAGVIGIREVFLLAGLVAFGAAGLTAVLFRMDSSSRPVGLVQPALAETLAGGEELADRRSAA